MFKNKVLSRLAQTKLVGSLAPKLANVSMKAKTVSPDVFLVIGVLAGVAAGVMAAKAHREKEEDLNESVMDLYDVKDRLEADSDDEYTKKEQVQALSVAYGNVAGTYLRVYGPSILMATTSVYFLLTSHGIIKARNRNLLATAKLLEQGFNAYRGRVRSELGEEADERYYHGWDEKNKVTVTVNENGKKKKTKSKSNVIPEDYTPAMYSRIFDASSPEHTTDKDMNDFYLRAKERWFNDILQINGFVMLNDVLEDLHMARTPEGQVVGWSLNFGGDNFIDFGLDKPINNNLGDDRIILDFNVNGVVFEYIS